MRQAAFCALALPTVLLQVMFVNGLSLPGGSVPDIALVLVVTLALTRGPVSGMLTGFLAGLCLDLAPPGGYLIGGSALVFCVIGYGCGRLSRGADGSVPRLLAVAVIAVGAGEAVLAAGGMIADHGGITLAAVRQGLPVAVLYDVLLCAVLLSAAAVRGRRSLAGQPGPRRAIRLAELAGTAAVSGSEPPRGLHRAYPAGAHAAGGMDHIRIGRGGANGIRADGGGNGSRTDGGVNGIRFDRVRLALARGARSELRPAAPLAAGGPERPGPARMGASAFRDRHAGPQPTGGAGGQRRRPTNLRFRLNRPGSGKSRPARLPARQPVAGAPLLGMLPRSLFRRQPRMCRQVPRWTGARSARHGGTSRRSGGLR